MTSKKKKSKKPLIILTAGAPADTSTRPKRWRKNFPAAAAG